MPAEKGRIIRAPPIPVEAELTAAAAFAARLTAWQAAAGRHDLPWQRTRDPYRIWLSEIMLQQTQVTTVIPYYERFLAAFPDVCALAAAEPGAVAALWAGLGYYARARNLHRCAREVVAVHGGKFPASAAALAALPGIGRSTAAAIAAFAWGERAAILDGNVKRVLCRCFGIDGFPGLAAVDRNLWQLAESLLPETGIEAYTQGLMDLGATVCSRARPRCEACPLAADCVARAEGRVAELPAPRPRKALPHREVRVLVIERAGAILFERRPATGVWAGLWSLPELPLEADLEAAVRARFGAGARMGAALAPIEHGFTHYTLTLYPHRVSLHGRPPVADGAGHLWLTRADALAAALPAPIRRLVAADEDRLGTARGGSARTATPSRRARP